MAPPGRIRSRRQQGYLFAVVPKAARKWAHGKKTRKSDWAGRRVPSKRRQK